VTVVRESAKAAEFFVKEYEVRLVIGRACTVRRLEVPWLEYRSLAVKKNMGIMGCRSCRWC